MKGCRALSDKEISRVSQAFTGVYALRNRALFVTGVKTGFRISELLSLRVWDVYQYGQILPSASVRKRSMKGRREGRCVPLHRDAQKALAAWIQELSQRQVITRNTPLFSGAKFPERPITRVQAWSVLMQAFDRCGITGQLGTHVMRKTFAKRAHERVGHDLLKTQAALGHANISNTVKYLSFDRADVDAAILA